MTLYLNYNCFQRGFDDPRSFRIQMEALACQEIFKRVEDKQFKLIWSFMHEDENSLCPFPERRIEVLRLSSICQIQVGPNDDVIQQAHKIQKQSGLSSKDSLHLACSIFSKADYFITCDDKLIRQSRQLNIKVKVLNPVEFIRKEF